MNKDLGIKIIFILILIISIGFIISGLKDDGTEVDNNSIINEQGIQLSTVSVNLKVDESYQVNATVIPNDATNKNISWTSSNPSIAEVDNGLIKGISEGTCIVQVTTENLKITRNIIVNVSKKEILVEKIVVNNPNIEMFVGDTSKIDYKIEPDDATNKHVSFKISDKNIAAFNKNGEVVGVVEGDTVITITSNNGVSANINVKVKKKIIDVTSVKLNKSSLNLDIGKEETLTVKVKPTNATVTDVTWTSSNPSVATVNNGKVKGLKAGSAEITATSNNGKKATCKITVNEPYEKSLVNSGFSGVGSVASCDSATFKYRIASFQGNDYVLIWVKDPAKQLNNALAVSDGSRNAPAESILNNEISANGYGNKCMVAANASFFNMGNGSILAGIIFHKGKVVRSGSSATLIGMTKNGVLKEYINTSLSTLQSEGVMTTFGHSNALAPTGGSYGGTNRTVICQVNKNNFVLVSGAGDSSQMALDVNNHVGKASCFNLDGGGSRKLYYKTQSSGMTKRFGGGRSVPDMIYFVE